MKSSLLTALLSVGLALPAAGDGLPDFGLSTVTMATPGPVMMRVHPDGSGPPFTEAFQGSGNRVDATVTLLLLDAMAMPIWNFPAEDIWLQAQNGGLVPCGGGAGLIPDRNTDQDGTTVWVAPPRAGGHTTGLTLVYVNGTPLISSAGLDLRFTSPDLDGSGSVTLTDGGLFTQDLFGTYAERSDLNWDGHINISDVGVMAGAMGQGCP
ncbi:MAG: hypothetical protein IH621_04020 [Krumholzibacteria bacterium]|nr:hypothetical protein [Candidatus Krumholzibacteria bacterium]